MGSCRRPKELFGGDHVDYWEAYQATKATTITSNERQEDKSKENCRCFLDECWIDVLGEYMIGAHICTIAPLLQKEREDW